MRDPCKLENAAEYSLPNSNPVEICAEHTHRSWLDSVGTPVGVQQKLIRHADIRTTMNIYGDAMTADMRPAHEKIVHLALPQANESQTDHATR